MKDETSDWIRSVLPNIGSLEPRFRERYSGKGLEHYCKVAQRLERKYGDPALTRAGFLHAIPVEEIRRHLDGFVDEEVARILEGREQLRSIDVTDNDMPIQLTTNVLPSVSEPRSILLLVLEQLDHLDVAGRMDRWTRRAHVEPPAKLPPLPAKPKAGVRFADPRQHLLYSRRVITPIAEHFGLWHERNVADNAELLYRDRDRFADLHSYVRAICVRGVTAKIVNQFSRKLKQPEVSWEWRHIGSLHQRLPRPLAGLDLSYLQECGFITILCPGRREAYRSLGELLSWCRNSNSVLDDNLSNPNISGFAALKAVVDLPKPIQGLRQVTVRFLLKGAARKRFHYTTKAQFKRLSDAYQRAKRASCKNLGSDSMHVFTPAGELHKLPQGATVLNLAYRIHSEFVVLVRRARVNRSAVDVLHPLKTGDFVWLEVGSAPAPLPAGWEEKVPPASVSTIFRHFKEHFGHFLFEEGRRLVREKASLRGYRLESIDDVQDEHVKRVAQSLLADPVLPQPPKGVCDQPRRLLKWWYQQIALLNSFQNEQIPPFRRAVDSKAADAFLDQVVNSLAEHIDVDIRELYLPSSLAGMVEQARLCIGCRPFEVENWIGALEGQTLVLHRVGADCGQEGVPVSTRNLAEDPLYYIVDARNRTGIAAEILGAFRESQVELVEMNAFRMGPSRAVFRFLVDPQPQQKFARVEDALRQIAGVNEIHPPGTPGIAEELLDGVFPPRKRVRFRDYALPVPYICGTPVPEDNFFYGMRQELALLARSFSQIKASSARSGMTIFVQGPKKVGKTSLALHFLRNLSRREDQFLSVFVRATTGGWRRFSEELARGLRRGIEQLSRKMGRPAPDLSALDARELLEWVPTSWECPTVIVIDEAALLLHECEARGEKEPIDSLHDTLQHTPGLLTLLIAPTAGLRRLGASFRHILRGAQALKVDALSVSDVALLLTAHKLAPRYRIRFQTPSLCERIAHVTAGNPYWVSALGQAMWRLARERDSDEVVYDDDLYLRALKEVCSDELFFSERWEDDDWSPSDRQIALQAVKVLAQKAGRRSRQLLSLSCDEILECIRPAAGSLCRDAVRRVMDELMDRGAVSRQKSSQGMRFRLAAPILADHLDPPEWFEEV